MQSSSIPFHFSPSDPIPEGVAVSVFAVIHDTKGTTLIIRKKQNKRWTLPGGKVNRAESPYSALCREVREELSSSISFATPIRATLTKRGLNIYFACDLGSKSPKPSGEIDSVQKSHHLPERLSPALRTFAPFL